MHCLLLVPSSSFLSADNVSRSGSSQYSERYAVKFPVNFIWLFTGCCYPPVPDVAQPDTMPNQQKTAPDAVCDEKQRSQEKKFQKEALDYIDSVGFFF